MNVGMILKEKGAAVYTVTGETVLMAAAQDMTRRKIGALVVVAGELVVGVLSERDVVRCVALDGPEVLKRPVSSAMSAEVMTCGPADTIDTLMALMTDRRLRHLPVMEEGRLAGLVSIGDVVKARIAMAEAEATALKDYITTAT